MFAFCFILIFLSPIPWCNARSFNGKSMEEDGPFSRENKVKILNNINLLNKIQAQIRGDTSPPPEVTVESLDQSAPFKPMMNPYLYGGDIVLTDQQWKTLIENAEEELRAKQSPGGSSIVETGKKRSAMSSFAGRWTFPIPYYIMSGANVSAITAGIRKWEGETCARFKRFDEYPGGDAVHFDSYSQGCHSYVGRVGGDQVIAIPNTFECTILQTVTHEIGHTFGLFHEHSRPDRDKFVTIVRANIESSLVGNFKIEKHVEKGVGYDYGSVMHYGGIAGSWNGKPTIVTKDPNYQSTIGYEIGPSFGDIKQFNIDYCSSICPKKLNCTNGGYVNPNNCAECKCPVGLGGRFCDIVAASSQGCSQGNLIATNIVQTISAAGASTCNYFIKAPAGKKVFFQLKPSVLTCGTVLLTGSLVINYKNDFSLAGAMFCGKQTPTISQSESNKLLVIYDGHKDSHFSLSFKIA